MMTGYRGTFVISWDQTEIDGLTGAPVATVSIGATWRWTGRAIRVDAPRDILMLHDAVDTVALHRAAARNLHRVLGRDAIPQVESSDTEDTDSLFAAGFDVTDGRARYSVTLIEVESNRHPLLLFLGDIPPADQDLWVVHCATESVSQGPAEQKNGVVCFVPGTHILTARGPALVEDLREGDQVLTRDDGTQAVRWIGTRYVSGARLFALPALRPVRLRANILGQGEPDRDLLVSPDHRMLIRGKVADDLFNAPEVLVTARDLVDGAAITVDHTLRSVTYIHLMLDSHQIIWANGVQTESFHPAATDLGGIDNPQFAQLAERFPQATADPYTYGDFARRQLTTPEAALLNFSGSHRH